MIVFGCEGCEKVFEVGDEMAGRQIRCKRCATVMRVPTAEPKPTLVLPGPRPTLGPVAPVAPQRPTKSKGKGKGKKKVRGWGGVARDAWVALGVGLGLAVVALAVPLIGFVIHVLVVVIHELGHAATAWLLASPALPAFDLAYGGGVSLILDRQPLLILAAYAALAYFLIRARDDRPALVGWLVAAAGYTLAMFTPLRGLLITGMGHGSELLFAGIFLYRALSGRQVLRAEERPLYAALGLFILMADAQFAMGLMTDHASRTTYGEAKGGGHAMDFDLIATSLGWPLARVAGCFLLAIALTPAIAVLAHRYPRRRG